jgi:hypothetical protein
MTKRFEYPNALIKVRDLRVGDLLKQFDGPFGTAMVKQVTEDSVVLHRPTVLTAASSTPATKRSATLGSRRPRS